MDAELEIRRLQRRVQELEQENAELRAQLAAFGLSSSAQGKAGDTVLSAAQMPSNTAATLDAPAPNTVTPSHNRQSIPLAQSAPLSVARTSSPAEKIRLFRSLFRGRTDVYALRWHSEKAQKSGYSPVCANEWRPGLCEKGRVPCAKCPNRVLRPAGRRSHLPSPGRAGRAGARRRRLVPDAVGRDLLSAGAGLRRRQLARLRSRHRGRLPRTQYPVRTGAVSLRSRRACLAVFCRGHSLR